MENGTPFLSKDEIMSMDDIPVEEHVVPEWKNRTVLICGLTAAAKNAYQSSLVEIQGKNKKFKLENSTAKLLQKCLVDATRQPLFSETDILKLGTKSAKVLERLAKIASRLSGMDEEEQEEIVKNSDAAEMHDSPIV